MQMNKKTAGFLNEFKQFIARGNVVDLAVGVIIGGAFQSIADSLTSDIILPFLGIFLHRASLSTLALEIGGATITYGNFLQAVLNFLIMAFVIFCLVKLVNRLHSKKEAPPPAAPAEDVVLLTQIRDLLQSQKEN